MLLSSGASHLGGRARREPLAVVAGEVLSVRAGAAIANAVAKIQAIKRGNKVRAELAFAKKTR